MNRFKKLLSVLLVVAILMSAFAGLSLQADALAQDCIDTLSAVVNLDAFHATLEEGLKNCTEKIDIRDYRIQKNQVNMSAITYYILNYMPEYFHVGKISYAASTYYLYIQCTYDARYDTPAKYNAARAVMDAEVSKLLSGLDNSALNEEQKALILHDRLISYLSYDLGAYTDNVDEDSYNLTGVFFKQIAVCNGYCKAYNYMLQFLGMNGIIINSNAMHHAWNLVYVDGAPYYVDCTWDDPTFTYDGYCKHENFLRSYEGIVATGHDGNDFATDLQVTSTKYDSYYWQNSLTAFQLIGDKIYYIDHADSTLNCATTGQTLCSVEDRWMPDEDHYYFQNYSKLVSDGASLFFNKSKTICKYNVRTETVSTVINTGSPFGEYFSIYGLRYQDEALHCQFFNDANYNDSQSPRYQKAYPCKSDLLLTLRYDSAQGTVTGAGEYEENELAVVTAAAKPGYLFKGFYRDGVLLSDSSPYTFEMAQSTTLSVMFEACEHPSNSVRYTVVEAGCYTDGYTLMHCNICGFETQFDPVEALGHNWGSWVLTREPTCSLEGVYTRVCMRDTTHVETKPIEKTAHTPAESMTTINVVAAGCETAGSYDRALLCSVCGEVIRKTTYTTDPIGHDWGEWKTTTASTCSKEGVQTRVCKNNAAHTETRSIVKLSHTAATTPVKENEEPATCTENGCYDMVTRCSKCGEFLSSESFSTAPLGHDYSIQTVVKPTATALGYTLHKCVRCDKSFKTNLVCATAKISGFKCKTRADKKETIVWNRVAGAKGYQIQISTKDGKKWGSYATIDANVVNFTGLVAGAPYKFRVRYYFQETVGTLGADGNVTFKNQTVYGPWATITSPTLPTGTSFTKLTAAKKAFTAQWKKNTAVNGYQIQYSLKSNFSATKTVTVKSNKTLKTTVKKLNAKKVYYVRVRTYKTISKVNYYSAWSKTVKVKTK